MSETRTARLRVIAALGIVQIFSWGTSFYLIAVLAGPIRAETGWSAEFVSTGISVALIVSGLAATRIGALIQANGGRRVLAAGMALIACGQVLLATAHHPALFLLAWAVMGLGMGAGLYDAAFSTLGRLYGRDARGAITALTLFGGFASTICWPISAALVDWIGWRGTCLVWAALHGCLTIPLCLFGLPRAIAPHDIAKQKAGSGGGGLNDPRFWMIAAAGVTITTAATVWSVHLITILTERGLTLAAAVGLGTLFGPSQVGARVIEMAGRGRHHPIWTMTAATLLLVVGFCGLWLGLMPALAVIAFGAGNGLWSIARGSLPLAIFGPDDYPRIMGRLATPILLASATGPIIGAAILGAFGAEGTLLTLALMSLIPLALAVALHLRLRRD